MCVCGAHVDRFGTHHLSCKKSSGRHYRHAMLNQIVKRGLASAGIPSQLEPTGMFSTNEKRPDGISLVPWQQGKYLVRDATCSDRLAPSYNHTAEQPGPTIATRAELKKKAKYKLDESRFPFVPIAVETLGGLGYDTLHLLKQLRNVLTRDRDSDPLRAISQLRQQIAIATQIGNAASIPSTSSDTQ